MLLMQSSSLRATQLSSFYIGGLTFHDQDNAISSVFSDGNSNSSIQINVPQAFDITIVGKDKT